MEIKQKQGNRKKQGMQGQGLPKIYKLCTFGVFPSPFSELISGQFLRGPRGPSCEARHFAAIVDSQLPSPRMSPKMPPKFGEVLG